MASVNEVIFDAQVRHSIYLQRYTAGTVSRIIALLNRVDADLAAQIAKFDPNEVAPRYAEQRLEKMLDAIRVLNRDVYEAALKALRGEMGDLAAYEAEFQTRILSDNIPVQVDVVQPAPAQVRAAAMARPFQGRLLKEWGRDLEASAFARVRDAIRIGFTEGETTDQIIKRVRGTRPFQYKDGILESNRRGLAAMVRTAVAHTANVARAETFNENADLVKSVKWVSTLDSKTSAVCRARDGKVYPLDSGPRPPAHWNCRSSTTPVLKSLRELGLNVDDVEGSTRASMDGQIPQSTTYGDWLKGKSASFQDDVLGPTKGKLFRDGGLTLDRFVDPTGKEYTLDELRKRDAEAFRKAGL